MRNTIALSETMPKASQWKNKRCLCLERNSCKVILIILLWQFSTSLIYNLLFKPSVYVQYLDSKTSIALTCMGAFILLFSPLAGIVSDVKLGRFKVLKYSTHIMLVAIIVTLVALILLPTINKKVGFHFYLILSLLGFAFMLYYCGRLFFLVSIIQFGTDQLRDSPSNLSVLFLHMFLWLNNLSNLLTVLVWNIPGPKITLNASHNIIHINTTKVIVLEVILSLSAISSIIVMSVVNMNHSSFLTDSIKGNPYRLVCSVIRFAIQHKKPIRRSAFTYCGNENPSRIDYGKKIYGGPFTTEQVEDVKVFLSISAVLLSLGPIFLLDLSASTHFNHYRRHYLNSNTTFKKVLVDNGLVSPLLISVCIPFYLIVKPFCSRFIPSMFKRIGFSISLLTAMFVVYLIYNSIAAPDDFTLGNGHVRCKSNTTKFILQKKIISLPEVYMLILQHIVSALYEMLLYISVWEFICSQSPQYMKGLLFGLLYSIRAFYQLMAAVLLYVFFSEWTLPILSCQSGYFVLNITVGLVSLCFFTITARSYKYRKRDDICNIYQYAENYYSNIQ